MVIPKGRLDTVYYDAACVMKRRLVFTLMRHVSLGHMKEEVGVYSDVSCVT